MYTHEFHTVNGGNLDREQKKNKNKTLSINTKNKKYLQKNNNHVLWNLFWWVKRMKKKMEKLNQEEGVDWLNLI